jgi:hypothetical protein
MKQNVTVISDSTLVPLYMEGTMRDLHRCKIS